MDKINSKVPALLFFSIIAFYCLFIARMGFENWDTGYIPSFSWRVLNGQYIYKDFIYKGPPLTIYFQALFMKILPLNGQFYWIKIINYLFFALQVFLVVSGFFNLYENLKAKYNKWVIMTLCFTISLLNFGCYPWPTTDGLLFASIAFFIATKKKNHYLSIFLISFFSILSALTKQSFYLIPLFFALWVFIEHGYKKGMLFLVFSALQLCLFFSWILSFTTYSNFLKQTTGQTTLLDLWHAGVLNYIWYYNYKIVIYPIILLFAVFFTLLTEKTKKVTAQSLLKNLSLIIFSIGIIYCFKDFLVGSRIVFVSCVFSMILKMLFDGQNYKELFPCFILLGISWSASISLGYPFPILFSTGIILTALFLFDSGKKPYLTFLIAFTLSLIAMSYNLTPYREENILKITDRLDFVSPKLKYIRTNQGNSKKLTNLKLLIKKYGSSFIVAPNIPMAHYIFNSKSVMPADWLINSEVNKDAELFISIAADKKNYIFLEKSFLKKEIMMTEKKEDFSIIASYIYKNFNKIDESAYFIVYNGIKTYEKIPQIN